MSRETDKREIVVGQRVYCSLHWAGEGTITAIHGQQRPETVQSLGGGVGCTGGAAQFEIVFDSGHRARSTPESLIRSSVQWAILDEIDTPEQMQARIEYADQCDREKAEKARLEAEERVRLRAELPARYPHLTRAVQGGKLYGPTLAAANIRIELRDQFPAVQFRVVTRKYSGGNSIHVSWSDGPTTDEVSAFTSKYQGGNFNAMEDLYEYNHQVFPELFGRARHVFTERSMSPDTERVLLPWAQGLFNPDSDHARTGPAYNCHSPENLAYLLFAATSVPAGAVVTGVEPHTDEHSTSAGPNSGYRITFTVPEQAQAAAGLGHDALDIRDNDERDGLEIRFPAKPDQSILDSLKSHGWRWSRASACWYTRRSAEARAFAESLVTQSA